MPIQTTKSTTFLRFADGAKVAVDDDGSGTFRDLGVCQGSVNASLDFTKEKIETANGGVVANRYRQMLISGSFTLIDLDPQNISELSAGMITRTQVAGVLFDTAPDQAISYLGTGIEMFDLAPTTAAGVAVRVATLGALTSVTGSVNGALTVNVDYTIVANPNSFSGYSIVFNPAGATLTATAQTITVDYDDVTPYASQTLTMGTTTGTLSAVAIRFTQEDSAGDVIARVTIYSATPNSGGIQFGFKGAEEGGIDELPISFEGDLDTTRTDGDQLLSFYTEVA